MAEQVSSILGVRHLAREMMMQPFNWPPQSLKLAVRSPHFDKKPKLAAALALFHRDGWKPPLLEELRDGTPERFGFQYPEWVRTHAQKRIAVIERANEQISKKLEALEQRAAPLTEEERLELGGIVISPWASDSNQERALRLIFPNGVPSHSQSGPKPSPAP